MGLDNISVKALSLDMSLCESNEGKTDQKKPEKMGMCKAVFLISRSIVGVGVLTQPHLNAEYGILS